jgi:hypothetical protein
MEKENGSREGGAVFCLFGKFVEYCFMRASDVSTAEAFQKMT